MQDRFAIKISGPAGTGIMQAGEIFSKALNRLGFYTLVYPEYPSRIRGGDNNVQIVFSTDSVGAPQQKIDLLFAFNQECLNNHKEEVKENGLIFEYDKLEIKVDQELVKNSATLGFLWKVLGFELPVLKDQIKEIFADNQKILELNFKAVEMGYVKGEAAPLRPPTWRVLLEAERDIVNLTGNEALVKGILAADCQFASIYPMTPINSILAQLSKSKITIFRPEDEIAGICSAIGASYAGKRAMVATSGGGFSLMVEGLGMTGMAEIPLVIILGQRTGPSTGIATYSSQADLKFAINAGQGEFPRIVLTPGDLKELYFFGAQAFNLADIYQVPVILLTDKYLAESRFSVDKQELEQKIEINRGKLAKVFENYKRYKITDDGISPRVFPGQTSFLTNSYEHDECGFSIEDVQTRNKMMEKRARKLLDIGKRDKGYQRYGKDGEILLVGWGSTKGILLDFVKKHPQYSLLHFWRAWPFPKEAAQILKDAKKVICVEANYSGQMADLIGLKTSIKVERITKDDGRPFFKEEIEKLISNV